MAKTSVADLVTPSAWERTIDPDVYAAGRALADAHEVKVKEFKDSRIGASVRDPWAHLDAVVRLEAIGGVLDWSCSCPDVSQWIACRHVAAVGIEAARLAQSKKK